VLVLQDRGHVNKMDWMSLKPSDVLISWRPCVLNLYRTRVSLEAWAVLTGSNYWAL